MAKEDKQVKERFLDYWDKEVKRLDQRIDEGFAAETSVVFPSP